MQRKEIIQLVSRALSLLFGIFALLDATYLPGRKYSYLHYTNSHTPILPDAGSYMANSYRLDGVLMLLRVLIYLWAARAFWKCPAWVERALCPDRES